MVSHWSPVLIFYAFSPWGLLLVPFTGSLGKHVALILIFILWWVCYVWLCGLCYSCRGGFTGNSFPEPTLPLCIFFWLSGWYIFSSADVMSLEQCTGVPCLSHGNHALIQVSWVISSPSLAFFKCQKFMRLVNLYFVDLEGSPLDICRAVKLQPFSYLAKGIICSNLLSLVFQLVHKFGVYKWPCNFPAILLLPLKMVGARGRMYL